jgi:hypothetical protein
MGWNNSPPYFCSFTETIADIANNTLTKPLPHHPLEIIAQTTPFPTAGDYAASTVLPHPLHCNADVAQKTNYQRSPFSASLKFLKPTLFCQ